jgi:signal transduction histidine kinase
LTLSYTERMVRERIRDYLFPGEAEADRGFQREIERLAVLGLRIIAGVQVGVSVFMLAVRFVVTPQSAALSLRVQQAAVIIALGILNAWISRNPRIAPLARSLGLISSLATAGVLIWASLLASSRSTNPNDFIPGQITLVMLVAVTTIPLRPMQTLAMGFAIGFEYLVLSVVAERQLMEGLGPDENYSLFVIMLAGLCTGMTAIVYRQRVSHYLVLQQTIEAAEALREAQTRIVMTESASSLSRLAAAVSHEMNNPIGALLSGVDTLLLLAAKQATSEAKDQTRLIKLQSDVRRSIQESAQRLRELVGRMQRFTNLDEAEVQSADVNELLKDVAALVSPELRRRAHIEMNLEPIKPIVCRPQQLSVVFSSILDNAFRAVNGDGRVIVTTRPAIKEVEIDIEDNGRGVKANDLESIFDPAFRVEGGRIAAGNWGLFNSRQIVREHGGEIRILSSEGHGTRVTITLPYDSFEQN